MLLAIDVGNTQTNLGLFNEQGTLIHLWRMATTSSNTPDELQMHLDGFFRMSNVDLGHICHVAIASVVPLLTQQWSHAMKRISQSADVYVIDATQDCGIPICVPHPHEVGADRVANAVSAYNTYGPSSIVIDFGTATNIDIVDKQGRFCGGVIMPGLLLSAHALFARAAKLSSVPLVVPSATIGTTTETNIRSGIIIGAAAQVEGMVSRIKAELDEPDAHVIATGGCANMVADATTLFESVDLDLTVRGIYQIRTWRAKHSEHTR